MPTLSTLLLTLALAADPAPGKPFAITVIDEQTGRGVPLVELRTVNNLRFWTDSNGVVAFREPGLMGQTVFFYVAGHGYEHAPDGFGFRGKALDVVEGGAARLTVKRLNVAERLYRVTGGGVYADSVLVGAKIPLRRPLLNAGVVGSDSVVSAVYRGKLFWFWGDTNRPAYPLGNFHVPGATSLLPSAGGLDPETGVDLDYFVDAKGFAKETARLPGEGPTWLQGLVVLKDGAGERLFAPYDKVKPPLDVYERGLAEFDGEKQEFRKVVAFAKDAPLTPQGHPFRHAVGGVDYVYFAHPYPLTRVRADVAALKDLSAYEGFTCLKEGTRPGDGQIERVSGRARYAWKKNTPVVGPAEQAGLIRAGKLKPDEALLALRDVETGKPVLAHGGSVNWNDYRRRWVLIVVQSFGTSPLGEVWYAEADTPLGPWVYARKVVTHDRYSFYNPKQHPYFDKAGGRVIFFEGTYTNTFSGNPEATPRYDYNQILYKLDLADPRLALPVAVYPLPGGRLGTVHDLKPGTERTPAFFALDRAANGAVPVYDYEEGLTLDKEKAAGTRPVFFALPPDTKAPPATTTPLYEFVRAGGKRRVYSTDREAGEGSRRADRPLALVGSTPWNVALVKE